MGPDFPPLEGVEHRFVDAGGLRVHVAEAGAGEPLVLQHGWPQHWFAWRQMLPALAERYRVICPDLRGHGWTDAPSDGYEKEQFATDLLGVLDALGLERVRLIGHDWGGFAGFLACLRAPERFSRFVALGILHPWPPAERPTVRRAARGWYQVVLASPVIGQRVLQHGFVQRALIASRKAGRWTDEELATFGERWRDPARARATVSLYRTFLTKELRPIVAGAYADRRLVVPTRLLLGEDDQVFRGDPVTGWEDHADDMEVGWIPGAAHWLPNEAPDAVLERTAAFLA